MEEFMLPCLNKQLFGIDCLGCGAQRALVLVLQGEFSAAFKMFPAIYPILILLLFLVTNLFYKFKGDWYIKAGLIVVSAAVIIGAYIYKMSFLIN
ncbi:DUF2752 domain-containing protein [Salinimicrobium sp. MT39]|jgi:hypothetical protein|uniref:DUF2752 domain-containing protein n=1 Tax=Salinimicrobium profundisediminis TaxID=2994553 RepID=A0A9X3I0C5_9FLAO|nr:DUF2752 domain-containing protein [Salinimicrobium profundisediminis]MCX2837293.1 DUF2752 domain-containing protein [Salinimicrobium profundisediminis]